jgi:hypothetical protein
MLTMTEESYHHKQNHTFIFKFFFISQSLKPLRPSFLNKQERGKELAALVVPSLWDKPCICVLLRALRNSLFFIVYKK